MEEEHGAIDEAPTFVQDEPRMVGSTQFTKEIFNVRKSAETQASCNVVTMNVQSAGPFCGTPSSRLVY